MQGKDELPLILSTASSTNSTPPAPPNTPIHHLVPQSQTTSGPQLIRPEQMQHYMGNVFFKVPSELRADIDALDSDSEELDFTL